MPLHGEVGRQPGVHGVVGTQHSRAQQAREDGRAAQGLPENIQPVCRRGQRPGARVERRFRHAPAYIDDQQRGGDAEPKEHAPRDLGRQHRIQTAIDQRRRRPADRPAALHEAGGLTAMARLDGLCDQHGADSPFAAEAQALQRAREEQRGIGVSEAAQRSERGEPGDGPLQNAHPAITVGEDAGGPPADGGGHQRPRDDVTRLRTAHMPYREQRRDDERVDHEVEAVEAIA